VPSCPRALDSKLLLKTAVVRINVQRTKKGHVIAALKKEIAECLRTGKDENARIKVEQIIKEEYICEAYEELLIFCEDLCSRISFIKTTRYCRPHA